MVLVVGDVINNALEEEWLGKLETDAKDTRQSGQDQGLPDGVEKRKQQPVSLHKSELWSGPTSASFLNLGEQAPGLQSSIGIIERLPGQCRAEPTDEKPVQPPKQTPIDNAACALRVESVPWRQEKAALFLQLQEQDQELGSKSCCVNRRCDTLSYQPQGTALRGVEGS
jgi:hypothetical protein